MERGEVYGGEIQEEEIRVLFEGGPSLGAFSQRVLLLSIPTSSTSRCFGQHPPGQHIEIHLLGSMLPLLGARRSFGVEGCTLQGLCRSIAHRFCAETRPSR